MQKVGEYEDKKVKDKIHAYVCFICFDDKVMCICHQLFVDYYLNICILNTWRYILLTQALNVNCMQDFFSSVLTVSKFSDTKLEISLRVYEVACINVSYVVKVNDKTFSNDKKK